jgi:hypothetical protein
MGPRTGSADQWQMRAFSSFAKNTKVRRGTVGEASNRRDLYALAAISYAFVVSDDIFKEAHAYARLHDLFPSNPVSVCTGKRRPPS